MTTIHNEEEMEMWIIEELDSAAHNSNIWKHPAVNYKTICDISELLAPRIIKLLNENRQNTIDECIACVPALFNPTRELGATFWNDCLIQTITNLKQLKK